MRNQNSVARILNNSPLPLYHQVENLILEDIASGRLKEGDLIPSEIELAKRYGVHQGTVRKAVLNLTQKSILYRKQGKGTFVVFQENNVGRYRNYRFLPELDSDFAHVNTALLDLRVIRADSEIAKYLQLRSGTKVFRLEQMGKIGEDSFLHWVSFLPKRIYPGFEEFTAQDFLKNTLWKLQEIYFKIRVKKREEFVSAIPASEEMSQILDTQEGAPILRINMKASSASGEIVEYRISHCNLHSLYFYTVHQHT